MREPLEGKIWDPPPIAQLTWLGAAAVGRTPRSRQRTHAEPGSHQGAIKECPQRSSPPLFFSSGLRLFPMTPSEAFLEKKRWKPSRETGGNRAFFLFPAPARVYEGRAAGRGRGGQAAAA